MRCNWNIFLKQCHAIIRIDQHIALPQKSLHISKEPINNSTPSTTGLTDWKTAVSTLPVLQRSSGTSPWVVPDNHRSPSTNIRLSGNTSRISHSKWGTDSVYFRQSCFAFLDDLDDSFSPPCTTIPNPTLTNSKAGTFSSLLNIWPMAYFSWRNKWAISGDVMRTVEVAVQTILPAHCRWTWRVCVMGEVVEAEAMRKGVGWDIISDGKLEWDWRDVWE